MRATDFEQGWAKLGAATRLAELNRERAMILKMFPELRRGDVSPSGRPKRRFSAAARRRMSQGMRKFWARRKAAGKA
jgi:hypothetical protein